MTDKNVNKKVILLKNLIVEELRTDKKLHIKLIRLFFSGVTTLLQNYHINKLPEPLIIIITARNICPILHHIHY